MKKEEKDRARDETNQSKGMGNPAEARVAA